MDRLANPHCPDIQNCKRSHQCYSDTELCFSVFKYDAKKGLLQPVASGCKWFAMRTNHCYKNNGYLTDSCILHKGKKDNIFQCCCSGDNCNKNLVYPEMNFTTTSLVDNVSTTESKGDIVFKGNLYTKELLTQNF